MMFNMGRTRLSKFKNFNAALIEGDWKPQGLKVATVYGIVRSPIVLND